MKGKERSHGDWEKKWYEKVNYNEFMNEAPILNRAQKGASARMEFHTVPSAIEMATMLREGKPALFKTISDVNRASHYFGLHQLFHYYLGSKEDLISDPHYQMIMRSESNRRFECFLEEMKHIMNGLGNLFYLGVKTENEVIRETKLALEPFLSHNYAIVFVTDLTNFEFRKRLNDFIERYLENEIFSASAAKRIKAKFRQKKHRDKPDDEMENRFNEIQ